MPLLNISGGLWDRLAPLAVLTVQTDGMRCGWGSILDKSGRIRAALFRLDPAVKPRLIVMSRPSPFCPKHTGIEAKALLDILRHCAPPINVWEIRRPCLN